MAVGDVLDISSVVFAVTPAGTFGVFGDATYAEITIPWALVGNEAYIHAQKRGGGGQPAALVEHGQLRFSHSRDMKTKILCIVSACVLLAGCSLHLPKFPARSHAGLPSNGGPVVMAGPPIVLTPKEVAAVADVRAGLPAPALTKKESAAVSQAIGAPVPAPQAPAEKPGPCKGKWKP